MYSIFPFQVHHHPQLTFMDMDLELTLDQELLHLHPSIILIVFSSIKLILILKITTTGNFYTILCFFCFPYAITITLVQLNGLAVSLTIDLKCFSQLGDISITSKLLRYIKFTFCLFQFYELSYWEVQDLILQQCWTQWQGCISISF